MTDFKYLIEDYIEKEVKTKAEKEKARKLLLIDLKPYMEEKLCYEISVESLKVREEYRMGVSDAFSELLNKTKNSKEPTRDRLLSFTNYLKETWRIDLELGEVFESETINPYERLVDLLKTLNGGMTKKQLEEHYSISRKTLEKDIDKLVMGTRIFGQKVRIRDIEREKGKITYQSSIHPVFLPLNLTEVYYLTVFLRQLSNSKDTFMSSIFRDLANRIYCQLSEYARHKIDKKGLQAGIEFPEAEDFELYNGSEDEEKMARKSKESTLTYLWKAGATCTIHLNNENMDILTDVYIDYDFHTEDIFFKNSLEGKRKEKIDIDKILDIKFTYR